MAEAGIRELRDHFSQYLDRVRAGEELTVTDRGTAIARLLPIVRPRPFDRLVDEGLIQRASQPRRQRQRTLPRVAETVSDLVADQRG
jgi:prevent-host-death family protein